MGSGKLVILSGPSGVGKDTVIDTWRAENPDVERVVAYATRNPRAGEIDGVDYWFVSVEEFQRMAEAGAFLEHKKVVDNYYATPIEHTERLLAEGRIAILKIDVQGALEVMKKRPDALTVILLPPDKDALRERLEKRATDKPEVIARRLAEADIELAHAPHYQHQIVNDSVEKVVTLLEELAKK